MPLVIWGFGLIALMIVTFMTAARWRLLAAANISGAAQANLVADSAINLALLQLLFEKSNEARQDQRPVHDGQPRFCALGSAAVAMAIEDEGGKVDINRATPELLQAALMGFGVDRRGAADLADSIVAFRSGPNASGLAAGPGAPAPAAALGQNQAQFQTTLELDQALGENASLFRSILPFVTVHSRNPGIYAPAAPPALFAALAGYSPDNVAAFAQTPFAIKLDRDDPRFPASFKQGGESGAFLLHAEAALPGGQTGVREAIVDLRASNKEGFAVRELRHGAARNLNDLRAALKFGPQALPACQ